VLRLNPEAVTSTAKVKMAPTTSRKTKRTTNERFRGLEPLQWAWLDLNQRPHPCSNHALTAVQPSILQVTRDRKGRSNVLSAAGIESQQPRCAGSMIQELA
jgi:hypothetical protein